jgi:hypothetical protein
MRADDLSETVGVDQFHDDPVAFGFFGHVIDGDNPRGVQTGQRTGLAQDPGPDRVPLDLGAGEGDKDLLDGHRALEEFILTTPYDTSATATNWSIQTVTLRYIPGCAVT